MIELEAEGLTGAAHRERSPERMNQRDGYRDRSWETRAGTVELRIHRLSKGSYFAIPTTTAWRRWSCMLKLAEYILESKEADFDPRSSWTTTWRQSSMC